MKIKKALTKFMILILLVIIISIQVFSTGQPHTINENDNLINNYGDLPFKDQRGYSTWSQQVNQEYQPKTTWENYPEAESYKCLSYGASSVNDWFLIERGLPLTSYDSFIHGNYRGSEYGTNPRILENIYHKKRKERLIGAGNYHYLQATDVFTLSYPFYDSSVLDRLKAFLMLVINPYPDPVTGEKIPVNLYGYSKLLTEEIIYTNENDNNIEHQDFRYSIFDEDLLSGFQYKDIPYSYQEIKDGRLTTSQTVILTQICQA